MGEALGDEQTRNVEFASWDSYWEFEAAVRRGQRYVWSREVQKFLEAVRSTAKKREFPIAKNTPLFRAQVGWAQEGEVLGDGTVSDPIAFEAERMKPDANLTPDGRVNAAGIPVLYLAVHKETAIAEVRPKIGTRVSVSQFRTTRKLKALDLTREYGKFRFAGFLAGEAADAKEKRKSVWNRIDNAFSQPVTGNDDPAAYVPTQILAEVFRDEGYEAITYRSRFGKKGYNVVIFDLDNADPVDGRPYEVKKIKVAAKRVGDVWRHEAGE